MKILIIDNYDSFTYNLVHMIEDITGNAPDVFRNDEIAIEAIQSYDMLFLSPGPGIPDEAGNLKEIIKRYAEEKPIFGVCLGLQAITEVFGGSILNLDKVFHGVSTKMHVTDKQAAIYRDIPQEFEAARYHSWIANSRDLPEELMITAIDDYGSIMSLEHKKYNVVAVQYHPESILTPLGEQIISNFIQNNSKTKANESHIE
jgi:anthranilate synthase component 2